MVVSNIAKYDLKPSSSNIVLRFRGNLTQCRLGHGPFSLGFWLKELLKCSLTSCSEMLHEKAETCGVYSPPVKTS